MPSLPLRTLLALHFIYLIAMYEVFPESHLTLSCHSLVVINLLLTPVIVSRYPISICIASYVFLCQNISYNMMYLYPSTSTWLYRFSAMKFAVYSALCPLGVSTLYTSVLIIEILFYVPINLPSWSRFCSFTQSNSLDSLLSPGISTYTTRNLFNY